MREIIFGPPGTGKTTHLLRIVEQELKNKISPNRIGYFAFTKKAADTALQRAMKLFNLSKESVQLKNRYWKIIDANGTKQEVKGEGVVGEQPILNPGERFEYTSGTPLSTSSGFMEGHYEMETKNGSKFEATIPQFSLDSPFTSNKLN